MNPVYQPARVFAAPLHRALSFSIVLVQTRHAPPTPLGATGHSSRDGSLASAVGVWL